MIGHDPQNVEDVTFADLVPALSRPCRGRRHGVLVLPRRSWLVPEL